MGKRKDCWNEGEEAQGFKEFPCKDDDQGRCACDLEELAEISLAFAREVAGHPDAYAEKICQDLLRALEIARGAR